MPTCALTPRTAHVLSVLAIAWLASARPCLANINGSGSGKWSSAADDDMLQNASAVGFNDLKHGSIAGDLLNGTMNTVVDNETITFESLLLPDAHDKNHATKTDVLLKTLTAPPPVHTTSTQSPDGSGSAAHTIYQIQEVISEESMLIETESTPAHPVPLATVAESPSLPTNQSSRSAATGSDDAASCDIEPPTPVIEIHGVPSPPTLVTAAAFDGGAEVSWQPPDDDGSDPILEYEVAWIDEVDGKVVGTKIVSLSPGSVVIQTTNATATDATHPPTVSTSAIIAPLTNGRSYAFKVRAKNKNGYSTWSAKSLAVSPLHPPDLCGRVTCSGHGTCFPIYERNPAVDRALLELVGGSTDGQCICRLGFNPPDCSVKTEATRFTWKVTEWGQCTSGCGGGQRTREAFCWDVAMDQKAASDASCLEKKPSLTRICNGMECGSKLVTVRYEVETSFDEVLFSPEAWDAFEVAFTTEVAAALRIPRTRIEITGIKRGSIVVFFQILPASRVGEPSLNDIVERLQLELANSSSTLRSHGTFARRVETNGVKLGFSIADQTVAGGAEDISVAGLIGTVVVLCSFVAMFGWFLRKRHERLTGYRSMKDNEKRTQKVLRAKQSDLKPMGIRTMA